MPLDQAASWVRARFLRYRPMHANSRTIAQHPELPLSLQGLLEASRQLFDIERPGAVKYTRPGSNWRPSACEADVIATRPLVQVIAILRADSSLHSFVCFAPVRAPMQTRRCFVVMNAWRFCQAALPHQARKAPCGIRTHDLPLTERVLYQLS